jgi:hypothetical protein
MSLARLFTIIMYAGANAITCQSKPSLDGYCMAARSAALHQNDPCLDK